MEHLNRKIAIANFYGEGENIYEDDLGWQDLQKDEAHSLVSKEIFEFEILHVGYNLSFYYIDNDTFYGLHMEWDPVEFKILPRDRSASKYIGWQCEGDTHADGEVLYSFSTDEEINSMWDTIKINGKSLEEVLERSFILELR